MGYLTGVISLGVVIIPSLGGLLAAIDWRLAFSVYGFSLLLALFFFFHLPEYSPSAERGHTSPFSYVVSLFSVLKVSSIRNIMVHSFVIYFLLYSLISFLPLYLVTGHGFGEIFTGLALSLHGLFSALFSSRAYLFARYLTWKQRSSLGYLSMALCFLLLPFWSRGSYLVSISFMLFGMGMGTVVPTIYNRATRLPPKEIAGSVIAIFNTMKYLGMTLSPLVLGLFLLMTRLEMVLFGVGVAAIFWALKTLWYKEEG